MNELYDPYEHGPDVEEAAAHAAGRPDDLEDGSGAEAPPRRRSSIASGLGALVRPSREARFGLAALLSFLILVTVLIMKREGGRRIPVAMIEVKGPAPSELAQPPASPAPVSEALAPPVETPPVPPPAAETKAGEPPIAPAPSEAEAVPAPVDPIQLAAAEQDKDKSPQLPPDLAVDSSEKPGAEAKDEPAPQPPLPADPVPAPSPSPAPAPAASTTLEVPEPSPPAATGPSNSEVAPSTLEPNASATVTPLPAPSSVSETVPAPAPALPPIVDLPNPAAPVAPAAPPASEPPSPMPSPAPPPESPATALPASPDPSANDAAPGPAPAAERPAPVDAPTSPAPAESQAAPTPEDAPAPELPAPADPQIPATPPPATSLEPVEFPAVAPSAAPEGAPSQAEDVPSLASPPQRNATAGKPSENASGGSLVTIPNVDKRRLFGEDLEPSDPPADTTIERPKAPDRDAVDRVESVPHVVQRGENFWTISRLSYGSGRFYKALWAANRHLVPVIDELYVGTTILIPPPEALDPSLIIAAKTTRPARPASPVRRTSRSSLDEVPDEPKEIEVHLPAAPSSRRGSTSAEAVDPEPEVGVRPRLPVYKIRANDTLRSIANRTLKDSHRADEILELNRTVINDPNVLTTGQEIKLPADALVGRRAR